MLRTLCATILLSTVSILALPAFAAGPVDEPYTVYVSEAGSYTRCGPSGEHYRTDRLIEGEALEVYLETGDGWLGIRPPETSFCWVPADQVEVDADGTTGTIIDSDAVAWIGTNLGRARKYRWQVQFQVGELVALIGDSSRETETGTEETWLRIVPPPGEFRWVHDSQVVKSRDAMVKLQRQRQDAMLAGDTQPAPNVTIEPVDPQTGEDAPPAPLPFDTQAAQQQAALGGSVLDEPQVAQVAHSEMPRPGTFHSRLNVADQVRVRDIDATESEGSPTPAANSAWTQAYRSSPPQERPESRQLQASATFPSNSPRTTSDPLQQLQVDLARLMATQGTAQQAASLRTQVQQLVQTVNDPVDRGRARLLIDRIEQYQEIANRRSGQPMVQPVSATEPAEVPQSTAPVGYDRQGWLVQVYSSRPDAPPFALTDRDGQTIAYLAPAAGINARRLLNHEVGIIGRLNSRNDSETPYFIAEQIVRLKR